jgi:hypothetical protein
MGINALYLVNPFYRFFQLSDLPVVILSVNFEEKALRILALISLGDNPGISRSCSAADILLNKALCTKTDRNNKET